MTDHGEHPSSDQLKRRGNSHRDRNKHMNGVTVERQAEIDASIADGSRDTAAMRQAVAVRLRNLELVNRKLNAEKSQLENQLLHVLERLATGQLPGVSDREKAMSKEEAKQFISSVMERSESSVPVEKLEPTAAPLAQPDYSGFRDSLVESSSVASGFDYSSLSDVYEDLCLRQDPVAKIVGSESSNISTREEQIPSTVAGSPSKVLAPAGTPEASRMFQDTFSPISPKRKISETLASFSTSSRYLGRKQVSNLQYEPQKEQEKQKQPGDMIEILIANEGLKRLSPGVEVIPNIEFTGLTTKDEQIEVPTWLSQVERSTSPSLMNGSAKFRGYETESVQSSSPSCSMFSSSSSSRSTSPVLPVLPPFNKQLLFQGKNQLSTSMPSSPLWPTNAQRKTLSKNIQYPSYSPEILYPNISQDANRMMEINLASLHALHSGQKIPTRQELITSMRQMYGLPTSKSVRDGGRSMPKRSISERVPVSKTTEHAIPTTGPPKVRISRRHIQNPVTMEDSSDTTSTTSHTHNTNSKQTKLAHIHDTMPIANRPPTPVTVTAGRFQTSPPGTERMEVLQLYNPQPRWKRQTQMGRSTDFLNVFAEFGQLLPSSATSLLSSNELVILSFISKLVDGLDAYTCSQGRAVLLQRVQPPFGSITPILTSHEAVCHSHESSDLTSELSSNNHRLHAKEPSISMNIKGDTQLKPKVSNPSDLMSSKHSIIDSPHKVMTTTDNMDQQDVLPAATTSYELPLSQAPSDRIIIHQAVLFRLSNRVKIWRRYWAVLNPSNILLHNSQQPSIQTPKRCILLSDIQSIRKPHNLSASITTGMTSSNVSDQERHRIVTKYRNGSVPVTRKLAQLHQDGIGRTNYGHFELILNSGKTHRLRGINTVETEAWMHQIKRMLRAVRARDIVRNHEAQLVTQGWLQRIKGGEVSWVWCRLMGYYLVYTVGPDSLEPTGYKSLEDTQIKTLSNPMYLTPMHEKGNSRMECKMIGEDTLEPINQADIPATLSSSSDSDTLVTADCDVRNRTIALWREKSDPVYLICRTTEEFNKWRDNLIRACHQVSRTLNKTPDPIEAHHQLRDYWRALVRPQYTNDPFHTNEPIKHALSKTTESKQVDCCVKMFASLLFLSYPMIEQTHTGTRVTISNLLSLPEWLTMKHIIVKHLASMCFTMPGLKDELFLQLIKQAMLSDGQTKRLLRRQFPVSSPAVRPRLPLFCARLRLGDETSAKRRPRSISSPLHSKMTNAIRPAFRIPADKAAQLGELSKQLTEDARLVFPVPSLIGSIRPEGWWPLIAVWECLCLLLPLFLPSPPVLHCLELLISIYYDIEGTMREGPGSGSNGIGSSLNSELSRYAAFCKDALTQTLRFGGRLQVPSALEVASISIRNPYTHSFPFSLPIYLPNGGVYEVISFNGGSEFRYVIQQMIQKLGLSKTMEHDSCLFAIYLRLTSTATHPRYIYLRPNWKMCDVISLYEQSILLLQQNDQKKVRLEDATVELVFRVQAFAWKRLKRLQAPEMKPLVSLLAHQLHADLLTGAYQALPTGSELLDLVAYLCRADHIDYSTLQRQREIDLNQLVHMYFPTEWLKSLIADNRSFIQLKLLLLDRWGWLCQHPLESRIIYSGKIKSETKDEAMLTATTVHACFSYLRALRNLASTRFGTTAFAAHVFNLPGHHESRLVWLVAQEAQINLLVSSSASADWAHDFSHGQSVLDRTQRCLTCVKTIPYSAVLSFGGQRSGAFFLVYVDRTTSAAARQQKQHGTKFYTMGDGAHAGAGGNREAYVIASHVRGHDTSYRTGKPRSESSIRKLRIHLTDLHAVQELTDTLVYLINSS